LKSADSNSWADYTSFVVANNGRTSMSPPSWGRHSCSPSKGKNRHTRVAIYTRLTALLSRTSSICRLRKAQALCSVRRRARCFR